MNRKISLYALIVLASVSLLTPGCRSRVKPATAPETSVIVERAEPVESPDRDFIVEQPTDPILTADLEELNRLARERGWVRDAFFHFDSSVLDADARASLDASATWLRENPRIALVVEGHCDERGTQQYNLALGDRRSNMAADYLSALGIDRSRLQTVSYGEDRPFESGSGENAWSQNRRAHLSLIRR